MKKLIFQGTVEEDNAIRRPMEEIKKMKSSLLQPRSSSKLSYDYTTQ
jgi:hypothetical protein